MFTDTDRIYNIQHLLKYIHTEHILINGIFTIPIKCYLQLIKYLIWFNRSLKYE